MDKAAWPPATRVVRAAIDGDSDALTAIWREMQPRLRAFLRYQGIDRHNCEDVAADIAERVLAQIGSLRRPRAFEAWFWVLVRNQVTDHFRKSGRVAHEPAHCDPIPPDEAVVAADEGLTIRHALATLDVVDRTLLWLREVEGLSYQAIGRQLDIKPATARVRSHRARARLEAAYAASAATSPTDQNVPLSAWKAAAANLAAAEQ